MVKSSDADTSRSVVSLLMVAAFSKRTFAWAILASSVVGGLGEVVLWWSWYAVRRTASVERARWLTQCAWAERVCDRVPVAADQILMVLSCEEV